MKPIILTFLALLRLVHSQCPAKGGALSWNGPCTYDTILQATGCALNSLGRSTEDLQEACDAAAFAFSSVNNVSRNFDERFFNGEGPFNDYRETDGPEAEMKTGGSRLYRISDNVAASRRILMPTYDSLLNYTYESYFGPGVKDKAFYDANETAREMVDDFPPYIANFNLTSDCKLKTMMCCFTDSRLTTAFEDNADVCAHDLAKSSFANNVRHGFGVYDSGAPTYCTAFKWDDDQRSASYQYRGNALFDISYGTFMRKGYVKNIPGAPLCSCIENMPIVTNTACRKLNVTNERYTLNYNGTKIAIVQNSVKVTFSDCGQDFKPFHYGGASKNVTAEVDKRIVDSCPASKETFLNDRFLVSGSSNKFDLPPPSSWTQVAGRGISYYPTKTLDLKVRDRDFRALFDKSPNKIVYRHCQLCLESHRHIFYRRLTPLPDALTFNFIDLFMNNWFSTNNTLNTDFKLYSTYGDAIANRNSWNYCNYDDPGVGFPRDCGVLDYTPCQWNSYVRGTCGKAEYSSHNHGFFVERAPSP